MLIKILFVCAANICRSPTAQVIFEALVHKENLDAFFYVDSAGIYGSRVGESSDRRAQIEAKKHQLEMGHLLSKQITLQDFHFFDYIIAMDQHNYRDLMSLCPPSLCHKISLLLSYVPNGKLTEIPDPYLEGKDGFKQVFEIIQRGVEAFFKKIKNDYTIL